MSGIHQALIDVMRSVEAVAKRDRNTHQNFSFRGIDAVTNAVGPALREHGVIVTPEVRHVHAEEVLVGGKRTPMRSVTVTVAYHWHATDGSSIETVVVGEAMDSGDKATPKAMSVAFRTAMLQALCLPTDEPDPDSHTYERAAAPTFDPADRATWQTELTVGQAKAVLVAHHGGDKDQAAAMWAQLDVPTVITAHWLGAAIDRADADTIEGELLDAEVGS